MSIADLDIPFSVALLAAEELRKFYVRKWSRA
jgi:hypothetical protein